MSSGTSDLWLKPTGIHAVCIALNGCGRAKESVATQTDHGVGSAIRSLPPCPETGYPMQTVRTSADHGVERVPGQRDRVKSPFCAEDAPSLEAGRRGTP